MSMTKFVNEDQGTQLVDLKETQAKLESGLSQNQKQPTSDKGNAFASAFVVEAILSAIAPAPIALGLGAMAMVASEFADMKKKSPGKKAAVKSNFFVPKGPANPMEQAQPRATGISMTPVNPADKKIIAKMTGKPLVDIGAVRITEMSLTGASLTGAAAKPASGLHVVHKASASMKTAEDRELRQSLDLVHKAKRGQMSLLRLEDGLNKGYEDSEQSVKLLNKDGVVKNRIHQKGMTAA